MAVLGLGRNYSADPVEEKRMWFNSRSLYLILAHLQSLSESFSHQLRHGRGKKSPLFPHVLDFLVAFHLVTAFGFSFRKPASLTSTLESPGLASQVLHHSSFSD